MENLFNKVISKLALIATLLLVTSTAWGAVCESDVLYGTCSYISNGENSYTVKYTCNYVITGVNNCNFHYYASSGAGTQLQFAKADDDGYVWAATFTTTQTGNLLYGFYCAFATTDGEKVVNNFPTTCTPSDFTSCVSEPTVTISSVTASSGQLTVNWSVSGITATSQTVQYKTASGSYQAGPSVAADATTATITGLTNGTTYTVKVTATDGTNTPYAEQTGTPSAQVLMPILTGSGQTRQDGAGLLLYIDGYPNAATYPMNKSYYSYENVSASSNLMTAVGEANAGYVDFKLTNGTTSGERIYKISCSQNSSCAKLTFADGQSVPTVSACTPASHTPTVRIGKKPTVSNADATINLQMADWGCATVTSVKVYYTTDGSTPDENSDSFEITGLNIGSNINFDAVKSNLEGGTYNIKVAAVNTAGEGGLSDETSFTVANQFGEITLADQTVCMDGTLTLTPTLNPEVSGVTWAFESDNTAVATVNANTGVVTPVSAGTANITATVSKDTYLSKSKSCEVTVVAIPAVTSITVPASICSNESTITATANGVSDACTYVWTVDGSVLKSVEGTGATATVTVGAAGTTGSISVTPTTTTGLCAGSEFILSNVTVTQALKLKNIKINDEKASGSETFCEGVEVKLKITHDGNATSYLWTLPSDDWTFKDGYTAEMQETYVITGATSGSVTASVVGDCQASALTKSASITVNPKPAAPIQPNGDASVCPGTDHVYYVTAISGATGYEWVLPSGWTGVCSAEGGHKITATATKSAQSGDIKVKATNDCGSSAYSTARAVTVGGIPVTISGTGAKSTSATYPWQIFTLTATTTASEVTWDIPTYTSTIASDLTVWSTSGKTAKLKSGADASDSEHYIITVKTNDGTCEVTSDGYDVYINDDVEEVCE